nr:hypothetical protein [Rhodothermus marinus]
MELGVTSLEMDVVIAGDGTVVVSHELVFRHAVPGAVRASRTALPALQPVPDDLRGDRPLRLRQPTASALSAAGAGARSQTPAGRCAALV